LLKFTAILLQFSIIVPRLEQSICHDSINGKRLLEGTSREL